MLNFDIGMKSRFGQLISSNTTRNINSYFNGLLFFEKKENARSGGQFEKNLTFQVS